MRARLSGYEFTRTDAGVKLWRVEGGAFKEITPARSLRVANHSPTGFEFGYGGSGPAQLALAILLDYTDGDKLAIGSSYQNFKFKFIAPVAGARGQITNDQIASWFENRPRKEGGE